jgi:sialidase-1
MVGTPVGSKSITFRVATVIPCTSAVAAISASLMGRGSGTCSFALRFAIAVSIDKTRPVNAGRTWLSSQARSMAPCVGSRRSESSTPISSSWIVIADRYRSVTATLSAQLATFSSAFPERTFSNSHTTFYECIMFQRQIIIKQDVHAYYHVPSLVVAQDGSVMAFCEERWRSPCDDTGECHIVMKKSRDHGKTWVDLIHLRRKAGAKYHMGSAVVDLSAGKVLLMCGGGFLQSTNNGETWQDWHPVFHDAAGATRGSTHGSAPGMIIQYGVHKGRILWPARTIVSRDGYNDLSIPDRQTKCYSMVLYSDDHGATIRSSNFFLQGTGEACLAERTNGDIYFNARAYFGDNQRKTAVSHDGGSHFFEASPAEDLREIGQGCNASIVRYPPERSNGRDVLLFVNPDTKGPHREHGVVHVSQDGGKTWPMKKELTPWGDWFDYSSMTVAHDGTILVMHKTTPSMQGIASSPDGCCSMALARFDLEWLGL